jgi:hypothetical protein
MEAEAGIQTFDVYFIMSPLIADSAINPRRETGVYEYVYE